MDALRFLNRASDGSLTLASYHPASSKTWHWSVTLTDRPMVVWGWRLWCRDSRRVGQWHDFYRLPFGRSLIVSRQDHHLTNSSTGRVG